MAEEVKKIKEATEAHPAPFKQLVGAAISAAIATALYFFTMSVAHKLALSPLQSATTLAGRIGGAVRTMLLALGTGLTGIFTIIALGLLLLTLQQLGQVLIKFLASKNSASNSNSD